MCLGVPGRVTRIDAASFGMTMGTVDFGGVSKEVCMAYVPEAGVGDFVLVHVGFALSRIDEEEARQVFRVLEEMGELVDLGMPRRSTDAAGAAGPGPSGAVSSGAASPVGASGAAAKERRP